MKAAKTFSAVLITAPNRTIARKLARGALRAKLVACVNLVPKIESHYRWQGRIESGTEVLMICKTTNRKLAAFEKFVLAHHPYDTPEFVVLPMTAGMARYLDWINASVK